MSHTVVLHIGAMKSGTSFIQQAMLANRDALAAQDFCFPGEVFRDQVLGVIDVLGQKRDGKVIPRSVGAWQRLVDEMGAHDGVSLVSMEFLGPTPKDEVRRVLDTLAPARTRAVITVRDLGRNIPAMWQEGLQNGDTYTWPEFLDGVEHGDPSVSGTVARKFWRQMGSAAIARRWVDVVGPENFTVVTVPPPGADRRLLLTRFCTAVGLDPTPFVLPERDNASLGAASAQLLRVVNERAGSLGTRRYNRVVKHELAKKGLAAHRAQEDPIGYDGGAWLAERAEQMIERFRALGVPVEGDLDELRPRAVPGVDPSTLPVQERESAAVAALAHLVKVWSASQTTGPTAE